MMAPSNGVWMKAMNAADDGQVKSLPKSKPGENGSNEGATSASPIVKAAEAQGDFISEMLNIRSLATCSICDQLLYEPWTLGCGHTYCYSCLCSWFLPNKRRKTCPDCRTLVTHVPAPAFLLKQMVDILLKRAELMPSDENTEQHEQRRKEENDIVEADRLAEGGLFKGCFSGNFGNPIYYDEEDLIRRCSGCGHEYNGGPLCHYCGQEIDEEYDFSNSDDGLEMDSLADMEIDLDDMEDEVDEYAEELEYGYESRHWDEASMNSHMLHHRHFPSAVTDGGRHSHVLHGDESEDEEPTQSELDFIDDDIAHAIRQGHYTPSVTSSNVSHESGSSVPRPSTEGDNDSDEHDEGGAVSNGRRRRPRWRAPSSSPSVVTVPSTDASEAGDMRQASARPRWIPLEYRHGDESHPGEINSEASDTDTMVGNQADDEERYRESNSSTPRYGRSPARYQGHRADDRQRDLRSTSVSSTASEDYSSAEDDNLDSEEESVVDREGDTDMSVSPNASPRSLYSRRPSVEILGSATAVHEIESDSSDESVHVPVRRRPRRQGVGGRRSHTTGARMNTILNLHQATLRDLVARQLVNVRVDNRRMEIDQRSRPPGNYRPLPPRYAIESHPSWASSIFPTTERHGRIRRQY